MAALTQDQVIRVYTEQGARARSLFEIKDVTGADTIDLNALGFYRVVEQAAWVVVTGAGGVTASAITGQTVVTAPAQMTHDAAYLLVDGVPL